MKEKTYEVNEVFLSVQGEGPDVGKLAAFVRFSGCNLKCSFCDTRHQTWEDMTAGQILAEIRRACVGVSSCELCVLTGGEPLAQVDADLCKKLIAEGYEVAIETNASVGLTESRTDLLRIKEVFDCSLSSVVVSPKEDCDYSEVILANATCLKILFPLQFGKWLLEDLVTAAGKNRFDEPALVVQPMTIPSGIKSWEWKSECLSAFEFIKHRQKHYGEFWRLIPQTQVMLGLR